MQCFIYAISSLVFPPESTPPKAYNYKPQDCELQLKNGEIHHLQANKKVKISVSQWKAKPAFPPQKNYGKNQPRKNFLFAFVPRAKNVFKTNILLGHKKGSLDLR